jgi:23S rRNA (guanosine2251-2'-O)-methyltransferase
VAARVLVQIEHDVAALLQDPVTKSSPAFLLALDQIQDVGNVGSLVRTAEAAGVEAIIVPEHHAAPFNATVAKSSAGAIFHTRLCQVTNLSRALGRLKRDGLWVVGLDESADSLAYAIDLTMPLVLVVGNEERGLRRLTRESCDVLMRLPMNGRIESLNAGVAGGVAMYEVARQRAIS